MQNVITIKHISDEVFAIIQNEKNRVKKDFFEALDLLISTGNLKIKIIGNGATKYLVESYCLSKNLSHTSMSMDDIYPELFQSILNNNINDDVLIVKDDDNYIENRNLEIPEKLILITLKNDILIENYRLMPINFTYKD